jgi:hypothetical protein
MKLKLKNLLCIALLQLIAFSNYAQNSQNNHLPIIIEEDWISSDPTSIPTICSKSTDYLSNVSMAELEESDCNSGFKKTYLINEQLTVRSNCLGWVILRKPWQTVTVSYLPADILNPNAGGSFPIYTVTENGQLPKSYRLFEFDNQLQVTDFNGGNVSITMQTCQAQVILKVKVFLDQGQLVNGQWLMNDNLRANNLVPLSDPYTNTTTTTSTVLGVTGNDAIVDWVFLELRTGESGYTSVASTRAALLQRDGDIVDVDGVSLVKFNASIGYYYVAIRHRNHLGFRTTSELTLNNASTLYDFTNNSIPLYGLYPVREISSGIYAMNGGDANADGAPDAFDEIIRYNSTIGIYDISADYNMDGVVNILDHALWVITDGMWEDLN